MRWQKFNILRNKASDHNMILLDSNLGDQKKKRRFVFDKRWVGNVEVEEVIRST